MASIGQIYSGLPAEIHRPDMCSEIALYQCINRYEGMSRARDILAREGGGQADIDGIDEVVRQYYLAPNGIPLEWLRKAVHCLSPGGQRKWQEWARGAGWQGPDLD